MDLQKKMYLWNYAKAVPKEVQTKITGGRLNGKTNIQPQWRYQVLTEMFGPIGYGWMYEIMERWTESSGEETVCFVQIKFRYRDPNAENPTEWSAPIYAIGGADSVRSERNGLFLSDESYKMALTDALSVACKMIGIGAEIYMGTDGGKYATQRPQPSPRKPAHPQQQTQDQGQATSSGEMQHVSTVDAFVDVGADSAGGTTGIVESVEVREGSSARGPWKKYGVKIGGSYYSTFDEQLGQAAETMQGQEVRFQFYKQGKYNNLTEISLAGTKQETRAPGDNDNDLPF